ncbi:MAG: long-chain fatty acid--CoA ligase, partial [Deltaproteobacteria bacterium]
VKIVQADKDGIGEIAVKGPNVMKGYYRNPEETEKAIRDGWLHTGDLGYIDGDGYLFVTGRTKEVIVLSSGKNIYPEEIEEHYLQCPLIKEICVLGVEKKPGMAESLRAVIVPNVDYMKRNRIVNFHEAVRWEINALSSRLPPYKRIMGYQVSQTPLPRTPLGKLKRYAIQDVLGQEKEEMPEEAGAEPIKSPAGRRAISCLERMTEVRPIRLDHNLELDLGMDSLARVELTVALSQAFSVELPDTFASDIYTVRDLIAKIENFEKDGGKEVPAEFRGEWGSLFMREPSVEDQRAVGLIQGPLTWVWITAVLGLWKVFARIFFRLEAKGIERIPTPPCIITPNHASNLDGFIIGAVLPVRSFVNLYFVGLQAYFDNWVTSRFARAARVIPIDPAVHLKRALQISGYILKKGKALCLFPEGGRTYDGNLLPFKKGAGILSKELDVPLVPTLIEGSFEVLPRGAFIPRLRKIKVTFGEPVYPKQVDYSGKPAHMDDYEWIVAYLKNEISRMRRP